MARRVVVVGGVIAAAVVVALVLARPAGVLDPDPDPGDGSPTAGSSPTVAPSPSATPSPASTPTGGEAASASQTPADAARDGVPAAVAALPFDRRVSVPDSPGTSRVVTDEGTWVVSEVPDPEVAGPDGYGEVLLLDGDATRILRAYPSPGLVPTELLVTGDAVYCAGRGGAQVLSWVCRIDRADLTWHGRVLPSPEAPEAGGLELPAGWSLDAPVDLSLGPLVAAGDAVVAIAWGPEGRELATFDPESLARLHDETVPVGLVFGRVDDVDPVARELRVDPAEMLVGDEADAAYEEETGDAGGVPNDYFIRDPDDEVVTLPVGAEVGIRMTLFWAYETNEDFSKPIGWDDFARIWATDASTVFPEEDVDYARGAPYWFALLDGEVVWIENQYLP